MKIEKRIRWLLRIISILCFISSTTSCISTTALWENEHHEHYIDIPAEPSQLYILLEENGIKKLDLSKSSDVPLYHIPYKLLKDERTEGHNLLFPEFDEGYITITDRQTIDRFETALSILHDLNIRVLSLQLKARGGGFSNLKILFEMPNEKIFFETEENVKYLQLLTNHKQESGIFFNPENEKFREKYCLKQNKILHTMLHAKLNYRISRGYSAYPVAWIDLKESKETLVPIDYKSLSFDSNMGLLLKLNTQRDKGVKYIKLLFDISKYKNFRNFSCAGKPPYIVMGLKTKYEKRINRKFNYVPVAAEVLKTRIEFRAKKEKFPFLFKIISTPFTITFDIVTFPIQCFHVRWIPA